MNQFHKLNSALFISVILIVFAGCQKAEMNTDMDREAIEAVFEGLMNAINSGDAASAVSNFKEDGTILPPNQPMAIGRDNIQAFLQGMIDMGVQLKVKTVKLEIIGDMAYRIGKYDLTMQPQEGVTIQDNGKLVQVFKREMNNWMLVAGIFNSSMPMPSPM